MREAAGHCQKESLPLGSGVSHKELWLACGNGTHQREQHRVPPRGPQLCASLEEGGHGSSSHLMANIR